MSQKQKYISLVLFFAIGIIFTACQKDFVEDVSEENSLKDVPFSTRIVSAAQYQQNQQLSGKLEVLLPSKDDKQNLKEDYYEAQNDIIVHTEHAQYIEYGDSNLHSYTFSIERAYNTGSILENLVFTYDSNTQSYNAGLVTHHFSAEQRDEFLATQHVGSFYNITYQPIDNLVLSDLASENLIHEPCTTHFNTYHITPDTNETFLYSSTNGNIQNECEHNMGCRSYTTITLDCPNSSGGGSGSGSGSGSPDPSNDTTSGGGSNNNNGSNTNPNDPDVVTIPFSNKKMPCESNKRLEIDDVFKQKMTILKDRAASQNFETLFTVRTGEPSAVISITDNFDYQHFQGSVLNPKVSWDGTGITSIADFKGIIHSHFSDLLSVLSVGDLVDMYNIMKNNAAAPDNFFYGLVNSSGTAYILQIKDRATFIAFGDKYLSTEGKRFKFTKDFYQDKYNIKTDNSNTDNEKGFVKMLNKINSGLQVFKSTDTTYSDYKKLNYINSEVVESDCN